MVVGAVLGAMLALVGLSEYIRPVAFVAGLAWGVVTTYVILGFVLTKRASDVRALIDGVLSEESGRASSQLEADAH